jgi:hypothetical protein
MSLQKKLDYLEAHQEVLKLSKQYNNIIHIYNRSRRTQNDLRIYNNKIANTGPELTQARIFANKRYQDYINSVKNEPKTPNNQQQQQLNNNNNKRLVFYNPNDPNNPVISLQNPDPTKYTIISEHILERFIKPPSNSYTSPYILEVPYPHIVEPNKITNLPPPPPPYSLNDNSQKDKELADAKQKLDDEKNKNKKLEQENEKLNDTIKDHLEEIKRLKTDRDHYKKLYDAAVKGLDEAIKHKEDLDNLQKKFDKLNIENDSIKEDLNKANKKIEELENDKKQLKLDNDKNNEALTHLKGDINNLLSIVQNSLPDNIKRIIIDALNDKDNQEDNEFLKRLEEELRKIKV